MAVKRESSKCVLTLNANFKAYFLWTNSGYVPFVQSDYFVITSLSRAKIDKLFAPALSYTVLSPSHHANITLRKKIVQKCLHTSV